MSRDMDTSYPNTTIFSTSTKDVSTDNTNDF